MKLWRCIPFIFLFTLASCPDDPKDPPVPGATCTAVCAHAVALECSWARPTAKGASCIEVCENFQNSGISKWDLNCRLGQKSCAAMDACEIGK